MNLTFTVPDGGLVSAGEITIEVPVSFSGVSDKTAGIWYGKGIATLSFRFLTAEGWSKDKAKAELQDIRDIVWNKLTW